MTSKSSDKQEVDWDRHIEQWQTSGMSRSQYAKTHHLHYEQFNYRYRKAYPVGKRNLEHAQSKPSKSSFIQVHVAEKATKAATASRISVITPDGLKVEFDQEWTHRDVVDFLRLWGDAS